MTRSSASSRPGATYVVIGVVGANCRALGGGTISTTRDRDVFFPPDVDSLLHTHGRDLYRLAMIPAGTYRGQDADVAVIGATNLLVASSRLDADLVYEIVRVLFEHQSELEAAHPEARHLAVPSGPEASPAPFHDGAVRYYRERGWSGGAPPVRP